jgi:hypothetical protein
MTLRIALAVAGVAATLALGVSAASTAEPRWQTIPVKDWHEQDIYSAAGRVWFVKRPAAEVTATSARVANGRLSGWVKARIPDSSSWGTPTLVGQDLVYQTPVLPAEDRADPAKALRAITLLPNGKFGGPRLVKGVPTAPVSTGSGVVRLPDRVVRLGGTSTGISANYVGACCDLDGKSVSYRSQVPANAFALLGLDRRGRLWLGWTPSGKRQPAGMLELDPETLLPRGKRSVVPGGLEYGGIARSLKALVCSDACRLVVTAFKGRGSGDFSWAPGEGSATKLRLPANGVAEAVAYDRGGRLAIAYWYKVGNDVRIGLARGDARGRNMRAESSIEQPQSLPNVQRGERPALGTRIGAGVFGPEGYLVFAGYSTYYTITVRTAILRY